MLSSLLLFFSLLSSSLSIAPTPLWCYQSSCDFDVSFDIATLTLPDTCTTTNSSEFCSMTVTFSYLLDIVFIHFQTIPNDVTLQIMTTLPHSEGFGTVVQYHCNSESLCEWNYINKVYHHYRRLNFSSILEVLTSEHNFVLPPLSEPDYLLCMIDGNYSLCQRGKCQVATSFNDPQNWEGSCLERSDFDQSIYELTIITQNDGSSPDYNSFFVYQCFWDFCNNFEMVERIRAVITKDYETLLPSLESTTITTTAATTVSVVRSTRTPRNKLYKC